MTKSPDRLSGDFLVTEQVVSDDKQRDRNTDPEKALGEDKNHCHADSHGEKNQPAQTFHGFLLQRNRLCYILCETGIKIT